jgi:hypothetical protein
VKRESKDADSSSSTPVVKKKYNSAIEKMLKDNGINPVKFDTNPKAARFFVIKSYSADDIHKAIKYNVWASTEHGNRRLDQAYKESGKDPIYLFFSVNASGCFCGMAKMESPVDYSKTFNLWGQGDKWTGQFALKWIFIKNLPNKKVRHIRLSNNQNKPVTNSRDTQEILAEPGKQVLKIYHQCDLSAGSILDEFDHYDREELKKQQELQEKESKKDETASVATTISVAPTSVVAQSKGDSKPATTATPSTPAALTTPASKQQTKAPAKK